MCVKNEVRVNDEDNAIAGGPSLQLKYCSIFNVMMIAVIMRSITCDLTTTNGKHA